MADLFRDFVDPVAGRGERIAVTRRSGTTDPGRAPVGTEDFAQGGGPLAGGRTGFGGIYRRRHDVFGVTGGDAGDLGEGGLGGIFVTLFEVFVAVLQAYIFALLASIYLNFALEEEY